MVSRDRAGLKQTVPLLSRQLHIIRPTRGGDARMSMRGQQVSAEDVPGGTVVFRSLCTMRADPEAVAQTHGTRKMHALVYGSVHCFAAYSAESGRAALCATAYPTGPMGLGHVPRYYQHCSRTLRRGQ